MGLSGSTRFLFGRMKLASEQAKLLGEYKKATGENNPKLEYKECESARTKLESEQTRLLGELKKATGENNLKFENKEIPADEILKIMDEMSKNVAKVNDTFKEA